MGIKALFKNSWYAHWYYRGAVDRRLILVDTINRHDLGGNMLFLLKELSKESYKKYSIWLACDKSVRKKAEERFRTYGIQNVSFVEVNSFSYYRLTATAGTIILDVTTGRRFVKREGQVIINTWHGTPLKCMGADVPGQKHTIGNVQRNLMMADFLCFPNEYTIEVFRNAYQVEGIFPGVYVLAGYPRNQVFFDEKRQQQIREMLLKREASRSRPETDPALEEVRSKPETDSVLEEARSKPETDPALEELRRKPEADTLSEKMRSKPEADTLSEASLKKPETDIPSEESLEKPGDNAQGEKRLYVYMPTWRGTGERGTEEEKASLIRQMESIIAELDQGLCSNEVLYLRLHPYVGDRIDCSRFSHIRSMPEQLDPYEILAAADCLITDYSSVFFDYACKKSGKIIRFLFGEEEYKTQRDFYDIVRELPFPEVFGIPELLTELRAPKKYDDSAFREKFCRYDGPDSARKICRLAVLGKKDKGVRLEKEPDTAEKNLLFYVGGLKKNGMTAAFLNLMDSMESVNMLRNRFLVSFQQDALADDPSRLDVLPDFVQLAPMSMGWFLTFTEAAASWLYYRRNVNSPLVLKYIRCFYKREFLRNYGSFPLDFCVHYNGYERKLIGMFREADCPRGIFIHNDMLREIETKGNQHFLTLQDAYRSYDFAAAVSESVYRSTLPICKETPGLCVIHNCNAFRKNLERAEGEIAFQERTRSTVSVEELVKRLESPGLKLVTVGRFSPEKNHRMLLEAFAKYVEECKEAQLILIGGGGELYEDTCRYAEELGLADRIAVICAVDNPMPILKRCDLFLLPSLYEGGPLVLMEADTLGLPAAAADCPGCGDFMRENGGYCMPCSVEGILEAIHAYERGEIRPLGVDYEKRNLEAVGELRKKLKI